MGCEVRTKNRFPWGTTDRERSFSLDGDAGAVENDAYVLATDREDIDDPHQFIRILDGRRHWLVAQHMEAGFERGSRDLEVREVWCRDADEVDAAIGRECLLGCKHFPH